VSPIRAGSAREAGYTLLALLGIVTVMLIALGAAVPHWKSLADRGKEAELVARGWQYAEAIRVFQNRFGRFPNTLAELVELEPRSIRRLWDDPVTGESFLLLMEVAGGTLVSVDPATGFIVPAPGAGVDDEDDEEYDDQESDEEDDEAAVAASAAPTTFGARGARAAAASAFGTETSAVGGPIHGVRSRADRGSYRTLFDATNYARWEFTVERLVAAAAAQGPGGLPRRLDYASLGRPFRYPPPGGLAGANPAVPPGTPPAGEPGEEIEDEPEGELLEDDSPEGEDG
jgi:type II secretory pathway pseudopilin PulG